MNCHFRRRLRGSPSKEHLAPSLSMRPLAEGAKFHEGVIPVEGDAGQGLFADKRLRVLGDDF